MSKNSSAKYCQDSKERLQKKAREKYQSLSKEQFGRERDKNISEDEKQKLVD